jgi:tRNA(Arg) A34 adenosine deaminase TadA
MIPSSDEECIRLAIDLALQARRRDVDPFGAVLVDKIGNVFQASDRSLELSDPTFHAELSIISEYCRERRRISLEGFTLYSSAEPCPMCAGAIHWARISRVVFSVSQEMLHKLKENQQPEAILEKKPPSIADIINYGDRQVEIVGPVLMDVGLSVFDGYEFVPKIIRHQKRLKAQA